MCSSRDVTRVLCSAIFMAGVLLNGWAAGSGSPAYPADNPVPKITSLSPWVVFTGAAAQTLTIAGTNFLASSTVTYNGTAHAATFVSATSLTIPLTAKDLAKPGAYPVVVSNPDPGGGASPAMNFTIVDDEATNHSHCDVPSQPCAPSVSVRLIGRPIRQGVSGNFLWVGTILVPALLAIF